MKILLIILCMLSSQMLMAVTMFEQEPNNKPLEANLINPPIKVLADMNKSDQDLFLWNVTDSQSLYLWDIQLQGITERLTLLDVMKIHFTEDGKGVSSFEKILSISSKDGLGIETLEGLMFAPGHYYFALSYGGSGKPSSGLLSTDALQGFDEQTKAEIHKQNKGKKAIAPSSYNLTFIRGKKLYKHNPKAKLSKESPGIIKTNYSTTLFYQQQPIMAKFTITEKETSSKWQLKGQASLGHNVQVKLIDANNKILAQTRSLKNGFFQFTDLSLAQGDYYIEITSKDKYFISSLQKLAIGEVVAGQEAEPNDKFVMANTINMGDSVTGRMSKDREYDYFKFTIDETLSANNLEIKLINSDKKKLELCLLRTTGRSSQCRKNESDINLNHISLPQGVYGIYVRGEVDALYRLSINAKGSRNPIMEAEPNDSYKDAAPMNAKNIIKGTFDAPSEYDYFSFNVDKEPQLWTIQANGQGIENIYIYNSAGKVIQNFKAVKGNKRVRLSNLFLLPGKHVVAIRGSKGKYLLRAFATGKPDKYFETEPNDDDSRSMFLPFDKVRQGVLQNNDDRDLYHFNIDNKQHIKLTITPPVDGSITYKIYKFGKHIGSKITKIGEEVSFEGIYPMGDYSIKLQAGKQTSVANYKIVLQRLSVFDCNIDCEPNDSLFQAVTIPADGIIKGWTNTHGDLDWYKLPAQEQESIVTLVNSLSKNHSILIYDKNRKKIKSQWVSDKTAENKPDKLQVTIPANTESYYKIQSYDMPYNYSFVINDKPFTSETDEQSLKKVAIKIEGLSENIKAFYDYGQILHGKVTITNNSSSQKLLNIKSHISHHLWQVKSPESAIQLEPQNKTSVPFTVVVPNDVFSKRSQTITIAAIDEYDNSVDDSFLISAQSDVPAVNPKMYWHIPQELLGGINVASFNLGAKRTADDIAKNTGAIGRGFDHLFDGRSVTGYGVLFRGGRKTKNDTITIDLVGEKPVKVIGFALNPLSENTPNYYPKDIEVHLSTDGINFTSQVKAQLKQVGIEQYFVLDKPQEAKYARLTIYNNHDNLVNGVMSLGEFKVIAQSDSLLDKKMNIASPKLGGNVIWSKPTSNNSWDISLLTDKKEKYTIRSSNGDDWQWVVGFHHQRAALIESVQWQPPELSGTNKTFEKVQIMASTESPVGPWTEVITADLSTTQTTQIKLDKPTWARYLKFNVGSVEKRAYRYLPETIKVFEQRANPSYQSIIGEWGDASENAIYEKTFLHDFSKSKATDNGNNSKQTAIDISQSQRASGFVQLEQADKPDWYKFKLENGQNTLNLELSGEPTIRTVISLEDENDKKIIAINEELKDGKINTTYKLTPEVYYYLKIIEPPRNVVFSWDTSGSTGAYHAIIFNALQQFTQGVKPGRDEVNFQPFGGKLLMDKWYGEPYLLKTILNNYPRNDDSSAAETYMHKSTQALENRNGSKAIIVITDAITSRDEKLWDSFKKVKPRVFSLGIVTGNGFGGQDEWQTDLMQAWARVNHGEYHQVTTGSQVEVAFERAAAKLREPANYQIKIESKFEKVKGPGTLRITQDKSSQTGAIELILDASGSMLKRLNGKRRINIAKEVLSKAVTEIIPQGTPLALRVFGNKQAGSCRTDLAMPLKPLDAKKANKIIQSIYAKNLAKTPIAASLAKVASDLKANKGKKIVILVTDGEETCDGKPDEVIKSLIDAGVDIRLNIVGFAIDDEDLKQQFQQWSSQGGGKYFDSNNSESLNNSVKQALQTPYSVYSLSGDLIAESTINSEPIELPTGFYNIKVFASETKVYEKYQIKGEEEQIIKLE